MRIAHKFVCYVKATVLNAAKSVLAAVHANIVPKSASDVWKPVKTVRTSVRNVPSVNTV